MKKLLILCLLLFFSVNLFSQKVIVVGKPGKKKRLEYVVGNEISFRIVPEKVYVTGKISIINDTSFVVNGDNISFNRLDMIVDYSRGEGKKNIAVYYMLNAVSVLVIDFLNNTFNLNRAGFTKEGFYVAGVIAATGLVIGSLKMKRYRLNNRRYIRVIEKPGIYKK